MSTTLMPYLFYSGRCEEAIAFYQQALGAERGMQMRFRESPDAVPDGMLEPGFENKIMHAELNVCGTKLLLSDGCDSKTRFSGFSLALSVPTEAEAHRLFNGLAQGGQVTMPLMKTFWSPCYGMVTDKFNVSWMVMVPGQAP